MDPTECRQSLCNNIIYPRSSRAPEMHSQALNREGGQCYPNQQKDAQFSAAKQGDAWPRMEDWVKISYGVPKRIDLSSETPTRSKQPGLRGRDRRVWEEKKEQYVPSLFTVLPRAGPARRKRRSRWRHKARASDAVAMDEEGTVR